MTASSKNKRRKAQRYVKADPDKVQADLSGIILTMIVKNESAIIERCLESAKPAINGICITDTGSEDDTVEVIEDWAQANDMPCVVVRSPFKNFGWARTKSFQNAKAHFPKAAYYLLLDADMKLVIKEGWDSESLTHDSYTIYQQNGSLRYTNIRLLRSSKHWKCMGVTHEYWDCGGGSQDRLTAIEIDDRNDGGAKADKFTRDKRLLLEGLADKETPDNLKHRYMFYLAQTYYCLQEYDESIRRYLIRAEIKAPTYHEETWYCYYQVAEIYAAQKNWAQAIFYYQEAWNFRSNRAEPLFKIAKYYREQSKHRLALHWAMEGEKIGYPYEDQLFIEHEVYDWRLKLEIEICGFYISEYKARGYKAHRELWAMRQVLPADVLGLLENNSKFYQT